jgi:hypothetical protein
MSYQAFKWAKAQHIEDSTEKLLLLVLAEYANEKTGQCWYKQADLARDISKTDRTVRRALVSLRDLGLIHTEQLPSPKRGGKGQLLVTVLTDAVVTDTAATGQEACPVDPHDIASNRTPVTAATGHACPEQPDTGDRSNRTLLSGHKPLREPSREPIREPTLSVRFADSARSDFSMAHVVDSKGLSFIQWANAFIAALQTAKTPQDMREFARLNRDKLDKLFRGHKESFDRVHKTANEMMDRLKAEAVPEDAKRERNEEVDAGTEPDNDDPTPAAMPTPAQPIVYRHHTRSAATSPPRDRDAMEFERKRQERREAERLAGPRPGMSHHAML